MALPTDRDEIDPGGGGNHQHLVELQRRLAVLQFPREATAAAGEVID